VKLLILALALAAATPTPKPPNPPQPGPGTNTITYIHPISGIAGIEIDPSDPLNTNQTLMNQCVIYTGSCNVWLMNGTFYIYKVIYIPRGVVNVYFQNTLLIPCASLYAIFQSNGVTHYHDLNIDGSKPCGTYVPPLPDPISLP